MPTITITSHAVSDGTRRRVAMSLTGWFRDHDADRSHVVVRFQVADAMQYFVGGMPPGGLTPQTEGMPQKTFRWAEVVAVLDRRRDEAYRRSLAEELRVVLGEDSLHSLVARFELVDPAHTYYLQDGDFVRAGSESTTHPMEIEGDR